MSIIVRLWELGGVLSRPPTPVGAATTDNVCQGRDAPTLEHDLCTRRALGIPVHVDTSVRTNHLKSVYVPDEHWEPVPG